MNESMNEAIIILFSPIAVMTIIYLLRKKWRKEYSYATPFAAGGILGIIGIFLFNLIKCI